MDKTIVIWFLGSNGSGKTTQCKKIHSKFYSLQRDVHYKDKDLSYTITGGVAGHVGMLSDKACCGTDTISKKEDITKAFNILLSKGVSIITVDGIMATGTWPEFLKTPQTLLITVLLDVDEELNFKRVQMRREKKNGSTDELAEKTKDNLRGKIRGFRSMYQRTRDVSDCSIYIECLDKNEKEIYEELIEGINNYLDTLNK